jgi:ribose transport system substrate-binding protein
MASRANEIDFVVAEAYEAETTGPAFVELAKAGVPQLHNWTTPRGLDKERNYIGLVDADGYGQAMAAAEILAYMMNYKGEVGIIYFALEQWTNVMRLKGAEETFAKYPNIKIVSKKGFTDPNQSRDIALGMLQANPEIDAIWATWMHGPATGAAEAVIELGRTGEVIVAAPDLGGIVGARFIADINHPIVGCGAADCIEMGKNSVRAAIKWKLGKQNEVRGIYTAAKVYPIVRTNLVDGFNKQTRGALGNLPREVLEMLEE